MDTNFDGPQGVGRQPDGPPSDPRASHRRVLAIAENVREHLAEQPSLRSLRTAEQRIHRLISSVADEVLNARKGEK